MTQPYRGAAREHPEAISLAWHTITYGLNKRVRIYKLRDANEYAQACPWIVEGLA